MYVFFDLDGVLVDLRELHRNAFIQAWNTLNPVDTIDSIFHSKFLEARPTKDKIQICNRELNTSVSIAEIHTLKQDITSHMLNDFVGLSSVTETIRWLKSQGHVLACCSNSIRKTIYIALAKLNIVDQFELILSSEDVIQSKPNPEIYLKAATHFGVDPSICLVFEDSIVGKRAAIDAGCHVVPVTNASDITIDFVTICINGLSRIPAYVHNTDFHINLVIPMAGLGSRFEKEGYKTPKPFLPIHGKCMYKWVVENMLPQNPLLRSKIRTHIIIRQEHLALFQATNPGDIQLHIVPALTEGPACTVLSIKEIINNGNPLVIANSDQHLEWDSDTLYLSLIHPNTDGVISTFEQSDPFDIKWSYAKIDDNKEVTEVAEKRYISNHASTGIYGWKRGDYFVRYAESMIYRNIRVNNEFYVCPVYNEAIRNGKIIRVLECDRMWGLGIPQDYEYFLAKWNK
jgi:HAD superfamily hydrolase (TIGR01509 family)